MKANCALAIEVLRTLVELKATPAFGVTLALTCDEEVGSMSGWPLLEQVARSQPTRCAFVMEPPASGGRVKTSRKGTGIFAIKVEGKAAHAGLEPEKGASAILELARQTEQLHALNLSGSGITLNVGVVHGGTRSNVVAAEAQGEIDVRFSTEAESLEIERILSNLKPIDERTKVFVSGGINRPPMERTPAVIELFEKARAIAADLDFELGEAQVGGASDGNFLAAMGIPVLDGLGISGDGAHAVHEHIEADDIARRGALLGGLLLVQIARMLIATWNVNSILVRMPNVIRWLDAVKPDVLCMQETKCTDDKFPTLLFQERGYQCQLFGQQAYNGVAILTRDACDTQSSRLSRRR